MDNITDTQDRSCSCAKADSENSCPRRFQVWEIVKLRTERSSLHMKEQTSRRNHDLVMGYCNFKSKKCMPTLLNRQVCLKGYCIVMGWNYNWVCTELKVLRIRNENNPHHNPIAHVTRFRRRAVFTEECKSWIRAWINVTGDHDPTGEQQCFTINFVDIAQLHTIYTHDMRQSDVLLSTRVASVRTFRRQFIEVCKEERVRIRKKIHTSTKCKGSYIIYCGIVISFKHIKWLVMTSVEMLQNATNTMCKCHKQLRGHKKH